MPPRHAELGQAIVELLAGERRAMHVAEIANKIGLQSDHRVRDVIDDLVADGVVLARPGRRFRLAPGARAERGREVEGAMTVNPRGFGFVRLAGVEDDLFVPPTAMGGAMHGDRVMARVVSRSARGREGEVVEILERGQRRVVGVVRGRPGSRWLVPDDSRFLEPIQIEEDEPEDEPAAGLCVAVDITRYPRFPKESPVGVIVAILGEPGDPDVEVSKVLVAHAIAEEHPADAIAEAEAYGDAPDPAELSRREDLSAVPFVTIDPKDARDHDDAIAVERLEDGSYEAWIAIADVSHYVRPGTALDRDARGRGFSVYLPDRAVPMLPRALSGLLCSLLPKVERLCMAVQVHLDPTGAVKRYRIVEGRMTARAFLSYDAVARALGFTTEPPRDPEAEERRHELQIMWDLASELRKRRMRRGALDFDLPEALVVIDDATRAPIAVTQRSEDPGVRKAYRLVEEMMLLANEVVARDMLGRELPTVYRVHGPPDPEKIERFASAAEILGVQFTAEDAEEPKSLSKFLRKIEGHPRREVLHNLLLRAMQQASYDTANVGHFGLASSAYLHFTSPIRRYPDLLVHRVLKAAIHHDRLDTDRLDADLQEAAIAASQLERNAMEAEREVADVYRALFMKGHLGDVFEGTVAAVTQGGLYVRLGHPFVDVLVPLDALGREGYEPDETGLFAVSRRSGDRISLGDAMTLVIEDVAVLRRTVFGRRLASEPEPDERRGKRKEPRPPKGRSKRETKSTAPRGAKKARKGAGRGRGRR
jgi:ribonuclease R